MHKKKILIVFGTRPEAIKMAPLVHAFKKNTHFETKVCVTAQHRQMLDQVLHFFEIAPDFDLNLMQPNQNITDLTAKILNEMHKVFSQWKPDFVFIHGDTTTSMATALASYYQQIPVAHVEAGLRTQDIYSPFPEEANRQISGVLSSFHFAPTQESRANLIAENISAEKIFVTGNSVIDALLFTKKKLESSQFLQEQVLSQINQSISMPFSTPKKWILVTCHRRENFGQGIQNVCNALLKITENPEVEILFPVHPNPNVKEPVYQLLKENPQIHLCPPLDYLPFVYAMMNSYLILSDSGGVQEEAPSLNKPVLVLRSTSERPEAIASGAVQLVGTDSAAIIAKVSQLLANKEAYQAMLNTKNPYGDGETCQRIVEILHLQSK